jgi:peptidoglycan/LPS O-acetylase OafA/YrhL
LTRLDVAVSGTCGQDHPIASSNRDPIDQPAKPGLRLDYLDGLRATAALYVVLFHAGAGFITGELPALARGLRRCLAFGHHAVAVFIVLSGYCLMLPVVRGDGRLSGGWQGYLGRRAWRILPPYYAALFASLLLLWAVPVLHTSTGTIWDETSPALAPGPIWTHLLLVHNLFPSWTYRINGPLWSVATEWQIYFFLPLVLLPVWRRGGLLVTLLLGFALGCAPLWLVPSVAGRWIPWYLGLFAFGMCAAGVGFSNRSFERYLRERVPWKLVTWLLVACCLLGGNLLVNAWFRFMPLSDALVGATTATLLVYYTKCELGPAGQRRPALLRLFESRALVRLGHFSYSLYLIHLPVVALCYFALRPIALSATARMLAMIALGLPASLATAYVFFLVVERRFIGRPPALVKRQT